MQYVCTFTPPSSHLLSSPHSFTLTLTTALPSHSCTVPLTPALSPLLMYPSHPFTPTQLHSFTLPLTPLLSPSLLHSPPHSFTLPLTPSLSPSLLNSSLPDACRVSSSEKVDRTKCYADFGIASMPYPGEDGKGKGVNDIIEAHCYVVDI